MAEPEVQGSFGIQSNDEHDRMTLEHYIIKLAFERNYIAPVVDILDNGGAEILDVGCGPGMWIMEMGTEFPLSSFTGIEDQECFPSHVYPTNANFVVADPLIPLPFDENKFDYVHQRMQYSEYKKTEWNSVVRELVRVTKPLGWIELIESDVDISNAGEATKYLVDSAKKFAEDAGIHTTVSKELGTLLREAGLENVQEKVVTVPLGDWGGNIGALFKEDMHRLFMAVKAESVENNGAKLKEYDVMMKRMMDEVENHQAYSSFRVAFGQKAQ